MPLLDGFNVRRIELEFAKSMREQADDFLFEGLATKGVASGNFVRRTALYPVGEMREFVGQAVTHNLENAFYDYPLVPHEYTLGIPRTVLERGNSISEDEFTAAITDTARAPFATMEKKLTELLVLNGNDITGASFFNDNSTPGTKIIPGTSIELTNAGTVNVTTAIDADDIIAGAWQARAILMKMRNSMNARYHEARDGTPTYRVMYAPNLEEVIQNAFVTGGATTNDRGDLKRLFDFRPNPYLPDLPLTSTQHIYIGLRSPRHGALGWGETNPPRLGTEIGDGTASGVIRNNMWETQVYWDAAFGYGSPFSMVRITLDV
jgi:hypothetical protein